MGTNARARHLPARAFCRPGRLTEPGDMRR